MQVFGRSRMQPMEKTHISKIIPSGGTYLEIGTLSGTSVSQILDARPDIRAMCIDALVSGTGNGVLDVSHFIPLYQNYNLRRDRMNLFIGTAQEFDRMTDPTLKFPVILVDADHAYEAVVRDLETAYGRIEEGGTIVVHDYTSERGELLGIKRAGDEFCTKYGWKVVKTLELSAFLEKA